MSLFWQSIAYHSPPTQCFEIFCSIFENRPVICRCLYWWYFNFVICFVLFENQKVRFSAALFSLPYRLRTLGRGRGQRPLAAPLSSPLIARKLNIWAWQRRPGGRRHLPLVPVSSSTEEAETNSDRTSKFHPICMKLTSMATIAIVIVIKKSIFDDIFRYLILFTFSVKE